MTASFEQHDRSNADTVEHGDLANKLHSAAYTSKESASDQTATPANSGALKDSHSWTYLVNFTANMLAGAGSEYKFNQLRDLKDLTLHNNSEVIVQEYDDKTGELKRYEIAHGEIKDEKPVKSAGTAADLTSLLAAAPKTGHLALINEAHGNGDIGFLGDNGNFSVSDFSQAVKKGLAANGHDSLDVLSMESCLMANIQVMSTISGLAKAVVASELEEFSSVSMSDNPPSTTFDMQPIDQYLSAMLQHQPKDGKDAAATILSLSAKSCDELAPKHEGCGTPTLAILIPEKADAAKLALNNFGAELNQAVKDADTRKSVDALIAQQHDVSQAGDHLRDLDTFADNVINSIEHGELHDSNGSLKRAAQQVLKADKDLIRSSYVNPKTTIVEVFGLENKLHGVNTYLPGPDFDIQADGANLVGSKQAESLPLKDLLDKEIKASMPDDDSGAWANFIRTMRTPT